MAPLDRSHTSSYSSYIVTIFYRETFSVEYWRDLEIWDSGRSGSWTTVLIDRSYTTSYWSAVVTMALSCTIFEFF